MEIIVFLLTVLTGFVGSIVGALLGWPALGIVLSVAVMGTAILWAVRHPSQSEPLSGLPEPALSGERKES